MKQTPTLGILGGNGWLGSALGRAALTSGLMAPEQLVVTASRTGYHYDEWPDVTCVDSAEALLALADAVVISVRPEQFAELNLSLEKRLVISLMAKVSVATLSQATGSQRIVRAMPNAAAAIGHSYTPWYATPDVGQAERCWVHRLLSSCGPCEELEDESHIDYLTALTGSGPAFPALLADALISHAVAQGITEATARRSVLHTLSGASQLMLDNAAPPSELVQRFLDYGGTTTEGLNAMFQSGFRQAVHRGLDAAHDAARHTPG
ncbi:pyrroline-5-carboxylate reductase dimerization domain-containing protein [Chromohalobacter sp.]|jgi:pyrroline-5-carboxylate reductase|uniref:pyrroline-5-carboxylate reductase family protein n=1 Tax=Chromohalobacter sp. TaxID=50740 RepID=UPI001E1381D0|nr:pyrroline-5-carboxylate reductase dimerization domain-containing protein [Chromohalobacter sp.]NQY46456.1 NAD(P)-binding domain-containing protein [Chromohalobacter sp.]